MLIDQDYLPSEIQRRFQHFLKATAIDLDLRFPDSRKRRALELQLELKEEDRPRVGTLFSDWNENKQKISLTSWPLLLEWHERFAQAKLISKMRSVLESSSQDTNHPFSIFILDRLYEIKLWLESHDLPPKPSLFHLLWFRWISAALRDEAHYLMDRFLALQKHSLVK